ncbi:unnamed protein product [Allacma fusca]|uniref:Uncharacterized protein n=1 Tax=Allacma fusca TaxID=39272 RepID=A0A8J2PGN6_9HEXA|nr:unnamed protein product [Allacma fusca]
MEDYVERSHGNGDELDGDSFEEGSDSPLLGKCCLGHQALNNDGICVNVKSGVKVDPWYPTTFFNVSTSIEDFINISTWQVVEPFHIDCQDGLNPQVQPKFMLTTLGALIVSGSEPDVLPAEEFCVDQHIDNTGPVLVSCKHQTTTHNTFSKCCPPQTLVRMDKANLTCVLPMMQQDIEDGWGYHYFQGAPKCNAQEYTYTAYIGPNPRKNFTITDDGSLVLPSHRVPASKYCIDFFQGSSGSSVQELQLLMCLGEEVLVTRYENNSSPPALEVKLVSHLLITLCLFALSF